MGFLSRTLLLPLAPVQGVLWVARLLAELAENEASDPEVLRGKLREAEEAFRRGEISRPELDRIEDAVFERLVSVPRARGGVA